MAEYHLSFKWEIETTSRAFHNLGQMLRSRRVAYRYIESYMISLLKDLNTAQFSPWE